jgi:hypothetical protein
MSTYPSYTPSAEEEAAVKYCQSYGAPAHVEYMDVGSGATAPASQGYRETWFTSTTGALYKCDSALLVKNPNTSIAEMDALQMLAGQPNGDPLTPPPVDPGAGETPPVQAPPVGFKWIRGYSLGVKHWQWVLVKA